MHLGIIWPYAHVIIMSALVFNTVSYNQGINPQSSDFNVISNLFNTFWYDTIILILKSSFNIYIWCCCLLLILFYSNILPTKFLLPLI